MDYAVYRAKEAQAEATQADWGSLTWVASQAIGDAREITVGRVVIKKGHSNPRHTHRNCEEVLYLMAGALDHSAGDEVVHMEAGDTIVVAAGVFHNAVSVGDEDADMIVAYSSGDRDFVKE